MFPWWALALCSAVIWGLHYVILENAFDKISPLTAIYITAIPLFFFPLMFYDKIVPDLKFLITTDITTKLSIMPLLFTGIGATLLLYYAITMKSATHAALLEITYPVFVGVFTLILLGQNNFTFPVMIGALLIFAGSGLIIYTS